MCTLEKRGDVFIFTIIGDDQHHLNPTRIDSIRAAISQAKSDAESTGSPSTLITTARSKFFSNGYDLDWGFSDPARTKLMSQNLRLLVSDLISHPMPTIAAVTGHAYASGFIVSLSHEYIPLKIPNWFGAILKSKAVAYADDNRRTVLADVVAVLGSDETVCDFGDIEAMDSKDVSRL